ncbi:MAG: phosphomannomutase/phosphoglucomutase [Gammaproteobacteria bacterium]|jgi:phosphomannomutase/phosphoglucomutase|nr:phosphomannomutase/phosphoglucomutase [Gammaproteobacteria bacterium]MBT3860927.1 phosphomannomutase/phosphoglucomutase [Gammaproteobacteria bacterium]MBT3988450.1 phosphomannomutase/phosphoglucomutase [Gammaproteobacteria bacterium]MBT4581300.1 phosphomannomutase/phosphoglucomutase [Gammaproteobacteria bacterium]MBT4657322.1 phosphomannomutase/phosphoglucomutase [Gammaproteobacteria bacterium]
MLETQTQAIERNTGKNTKIPASIFRAYDIRGVVDEQLDSSTIRMIGQGIASEALTNGIDTLLLGYDGRLSSPSLSKALIDGILSTGCNVVNLGQITTPMLYHASHTTDFDSGVMLTASHNPSNYNGLKIVFKHSCLAENKIQDIKTRIEQARIVSGVGVYNELDITPAYIADVCSRIEIQQPLKIVVDCGNAVAGDIAPGLFEELGCEVIPLYCDVDGSFPNHHPDPTVPENLRALSDEVIKQGADIGVAFDGDGDRLGLVSNTGAFIDANQILMLLVYDIVPRYPNAAIIYDVKCSNKLAELISEKGGKAVMHRSGHSFMKQKMQETNAPLGGEFAAHIFIKDRWYGFDDGLYSAARVLELIGRSNESSQKIFSKLAIPFSTPEIKVAISDERKFSTMEKIIASAKFDGANLVTLDGLRVEYKDGWGLIRASNTSPALLLRFEADSEERLQQIESEFKALIRNADKTIEANF